MHTHLRAWATNVIDHCLQACGKYTNESNYTIQNEDGVAHKDMTVRFETYVYMYSVYSR